MNTALDYEKIAHLYDSYCRFTDDLPFFLQECKNTDGLVLELMCGTGRVSIPLLEAGVSLTCVDTSPAMLAILRQKLTAKGLNASVMQADITCLNLGARFDLVLLPFQGFHELHTKIEQQKALKEIARSLVPNGRFICTLHNPKIRLESITQGLKHYGTFPRVDGDGFVSLSVDLKYEPEAGIVKGWQIICELDSAQRKVVEHRLPVQFSLIEFDVFEELLKSADFSIEEVFGNYDFSSFSPKTSPYIVVCSRKLSEYRSQLD
jgi:SAM-dependent methyltransferase